MAIEQQDKPQEPIDIYLRVTGRNDGGFDILETDLNHLIGHTYALNFYDYNGFRFHCFFDAWGDDFEAMTAVEQYARETTEADQRRAQGGAGDE